MNTPFKMKPGRGNMPKTGNGLPMPLRQDNDIELTEKYAEGVEKYNGQIDKDNVDSYEDIPYNVIPSREITMKNVQFPVLGINNNK